jgi:EAL domain-containing protein (putative c-di-GMP-specific phosphodiesterase class I)
MRSRFRAGETIFAEGDPPTTAFLIESGRVEVSRMQGGERRVLGELGPGQLLGEMAVIDEAPRSASATAMTECELAPIDRRQFGERVALSDPVVRSLLLGLLERFRTALDRLGGRRPGVAPEGPHHADAFAKLRIENALRTALNRGELEVHLQPVVELADATCAGYEALLRWPTPEDGEVAPDEFIRIAEETSLIVPIGRYVLVRVCAWLAANARGSSPPFVALNVSARELHDDAFVERALAELRSHGLPPGVLKFEITESLLGERERVAALIARCHAAGMQVALDDFGTGWSNLGLLLDLDFDQIKLDRLFVSALDDPRGQALVAAIARLARALDCDIIAEGVETPLQRDALHAIGCRYAQGWLFGRPAALAEVRSTGRKAAASAVDRAG